MYAYAPCPKPRLADPHTTDVKHTDIGYQMRNFIYSETESLTVVTGTRLHTHTHPSLISCRTQGPRGVGKSALLANFWIDLLLEQERLGSLGERTLVLAHFTSAGDDTASRTYRGRMARCTRSRARTSEGISTSRDPRCSRLLFAPGPRLDQR